MGPYPVLGRRTDAAAPPKPLIRGAKAESQKLDERRPLRPNACDFTAATALAVDPRGHAVQGSYLQPLSERWRPILRTRSQTSTQSARARS